METLTKAWVARYLGPKQRSVDEMEAHRARTGASGNCFDLALWLRHRLHQAGLEASIVSDGIGSQHSHVAVTVQVDRQEYLCDLGDMWLQPVPIGSDITTPVQGFFPAAGVTVLRQRNTLEVRYHRRGGKSSTQTYQLQPVRAAELRDAAQANQAYLAQCLVEYRAPLQDSHWEFDGKKSFWSTPDGLLPEPHLTGHRAWARRIARRTRMDARYVEECLDAFATLRFERATDR